MLTLTHAPSGPVYQSTEQHIVTIPPTPANTFVTVDIPVDSPLLPGSAVFLSVTQDINLPSFMVPASADVTSLGHVTASFFNVVGNIADQDIEVHILVSAHERSQLI